MNTVRVNASQSYDIIIGSNLIRNTGKYIHNIAPNAKVAIISDSNVWPLFGQTIIDSLSGAGISAVSFVFSAGESSKNPNTYLQILNFLAENEITRTDMIIALGGGVVGDMAGFAAATYLRGIPYVQMPTSLLAMVDSSVGGKTAIDLPAGKNLVGAFKQPKLVICDVDTLSSLPETVFLDGCAEIIKYGMLYDPELIQYLLQTGPSFDREVVITKCVTFKRDVVQEDEFDTGNRQKLNFGHTIGHGIEAGSNFKITHGCAVAAGMAIVTKAAESCGLCKLDVYTTLRNLLVKFSLPTTTDMCADGLYQIMLSDKKRSGNTVTLIIPRKLGHCDCIPTPLAELQSFIKAGL